jgi:hypothetical protein
MLFLAFEAKTVTAHFHEQGPGAQHQCALRRWHQLEEAAPRRTVSGTHQSMIVILH